MLKSVLHLPSFQSQPKGKHIVVNSSEELFSHYIVPTQNLHSYQQGRSTCCSITWTQHIILISQPWISTRNILNSQKKKIGHTNLYDAFEEIIKKLFQENQMLFELYGFENETKIQKISFFIFRLKTVPFNYFYLNYFVECSGISNEIQIHLSLISATWSIHSCRVWASEGPQSCGVKPIAILWKIRWIDRYNESYIFRKINFFSGLGKLSWRFGGQ